MCEMPSWRIIAATAVAVCLAVGTGIEAQEYAGTIHPRAGGVRSSAAYAPAPWLQQDPGDSLYKAAREALNKGQYKDAAELFSQLRTRYRNSGYVGDALYWEAFARYRLGTTGDLRTGLDLLDTQEREYASAGTRDDAEMLATRIRGQLARRGDAIAAERLAVEGGIMAGSTGDRARVEARERERQHAVQQAATRQLTEEDEIKLAALNALLMMDSEQAMPELQSLLQRRDSGSVELRQRAVLIVGRRQTPETEKLMLDVVRNDPDPEVRGMAVMFLARSESDAAYQAMADIVRTSNDPELKQRAVMALAQRHDDRSLELMKDLARQPGQDQEVQAMAIMMLASSKDPANLDFIRQLYGSAQSDQVKERILYSIASSGRPADRQWIMDRALDSNESLDVRRQALVMAVQQKDVPVSQIVSLFDGMQDPEMREQLLYVLAMRDEPAAVDKLMDLARNDPNPQIRQHAIMLLGRSKDPRVPQFLIALINK
jgi:HEAT repeat protein